MRDGRDYTKGCKGEIVPGMNFSYYQFIRETTREEVKAARIRYAEERKHKKEDA